MPIISVEKLNNANLDAETIEQVVNGEPNVLVESREGRKIPTLATLGEKHFSAGVILYGEKTQEQVNDEVENALTGLFLANKTYATVAAANADIANIAVNQSVWVSSATEGGLYQKTTAGATSLTKSAFDPVEQAKADATTKANAAEANAKSYTNEKTSSLLSQSSIDASDIEIMISNRRGLQTWLQANKDGKPTDFVYQLIQAYLSNNLLHNTSGPSGFIVSDRRGTALIDSDQSAVSVSNKYDLTTVKFHGSSTMRFMQDELFTKLKNQFPKIQAALYTNRNSGGTLNDLATEIGINDGLLKFTDNKIYATAPSPVVGVGLKYGLPTTYDIPISLTNGFKGTLKNTGFVASNVTSDFELPVDLEINFKSDMTDYANCMSIVNLGKNNMSGSNSIVVNAIVSMTRDAVSFLDTRNGGHTVVIGHTTNRGSTSDFVKNVKDVNTQLRALYFKRYFSLFDYIFSDQVWTDTGLTKTAEDIAAIAAETLPPSLTDDGIHLNAIANSAVTTKIVQFIKTLGWY